MGAAPLLTISRDGEMIKSQSLEGEMVLGRAEGCVIRLEDRAISRQHAVFRPVSGGVQVEKRSEFAPLSVNGLDCTRALIKEGDVISIGPYLMKLSMSGVSSAAVSSAVPASAPVGEADLQTLSSASDAVLQEMMNDPNQSPSAAENEKSQASIELPPFEMGSDANADPNANAPADSNAEADASEGQSSGEEQAPDSSTAPVSAPSAPIDTGAMRVDEEAKTKIISSAKVLAKITLPEGLANVTEFEVNKDEVSIGRGKDCDIVLNDKKASRKHAIIRRSGVTFSVKDLESANGVYVNGVKVPEQELSGDDILKIGNCEFRFLVLSTDYVQNQDKFIPVRHETPEVQEEQSSQDQAQNQVMDFAVPDQMPELVAPSTLAPNGLEDIAGISGANSKKKTLLEKFKAQPRPRQILIVITALMFVWWYLGDDDAIKAPPPKKTAVIAKQGAATYESLTRDQKRFVDAQHELAFGYYKNKEYDKAIFEIEKIFALIPDYKDSREIERYAKDGKQRAEALEEEKRKKDEEQRLKVRIAELVEQGRDMMAKKQYDAAREVFDQIFAIDPDNQQAAAWRKEADDYEEKKRIEEQEANVQKEINLRAWDMYKEGMKLKQQKQFREGILTLKKVMDIGASDKKVEVASRQGISDIKQEIASLRDPVLAEAKQAEDAQDLPKAFSLYKKSTEIDPPYPDGYAGMDRIRGILHDRAKVLYIDGVLAESYSDYSTARKKFQECRDVAPKEDIYHDRAERKLASFFRVEDPAPQ